MLDSGRLVTHYISFLNVSYGFDFRCGLGPIADHTIGVRVCPRSTEQAEQDGRLKSGKQHLHSTRKSSESIQSASWVRSEVPD